MRIGFDIAKALPPRDGVGQYCAELARALMAEIRDDEELFLYSLRQSFDADVLAEELPDLPRNVRAGTGDPRADGLDVFHATGWRGPAGYHGRLVFTCYDLTFLSHPECHTLNNKVHCLTGLLEARLADATFVSISEATSQELESHLGLPASAPRIIYPAPSPIFQPRTNKTRTLRLRQRYGMGGPFLLAVGTLEPRKNLRRLVEAYAGLDEDLRRRHPLFLVGASGWKEDVNPIPECDTVHRLGFVDREDLVDLYSAATVFAYPSLAEGFGLPVVEAMACGAPVLTSKVSSLPEVAGDAAVLVDPLDVEEIRTGLRDLIESPAERQRLAELGRERAAAFSWRRAARETLELYRQLVQDEQGT